MIKIPKEREKYKAGVFEYEKSHLLSIWRTYFSGMLYALENVLSSSIMFVLIIFQMEPSFIRS